MTPSRLWDLVDLFLANAAIFILVALYRIWFESSNPATISLSFLLVILVVATRGRLWVAVVTAVIATGALNFFFFPPVGTFTIAAPHNWMALLVFLIVAIVASNLSSAARAGGWEAIARRDEVTRLFDLSRDVLLTTESFRSFGR